jgi:hypothetical protein
MDASKINMINADEIEACLPKGHWVWAAHQDYVTSRMSQG